MASDSPISISFIDTHTGGEPTRIALSAPDGLAGRDVSAVAEALEQDFDWLRQAMILPPRGHESMVGAFVRIEEDPEPHPDVIFFNNVGYLGMCGHGTIGVAVGLHAVGKLALGPFQFETRVGSIRGELVAPNRARFENVVSYMYRGAVPVEIEGVEIHGDIAWGGNWFFICEDHGQVLSRDNVDRLTRFCSQIRAELKKAGISGDGGAEIDHIELVGEPSSGRVADAKNFVLCPGGEYDRSPCGTGTSAKVACMAARGRLQPGEVFRQESIIGSVFSATYRPSNERTAVHPVIEGEAHVMARGELILDPRDPFARGIV